jgi:hypothetical protein
LRGLEQQQAVARLQHRGVHEIRRSVVLLTGQRTEVRNQPADQITVQRARDAHERCWE